MDEARFALLKAEVTDRCQEISRVYARIGQRRSNFNKDAERIDSMAYQVHNYYCACEQLFETVAHFFENHVEGGRYHVDLLRRMRLEIEGIRPALISSDAFDLFDELRRFRHFFRHAYSAEINSEKLSDLISVVDKVQKVFEQDRGIFLKALQGLD